MIRKVALYPNKDEKSQIVANILRDKLMEYNIEIVTENPDLVIPIGGDGAFLNAFKSTTFNTNCFYAGINTGHLGFLLEVKNNPKAVSDFVKNIINAKYKVEELKLLKATVVTTKGNYDYLAVNDIAVKDKDTSVLFSDINIYENKKKVFLENFAGDGILVCSQIGSTAYNKSLGGSIIHPEVECLQITPISPIDSSAYRTLSNSAIVPITTVLNIVPSNRNKDSILLQVDGEKLKFQNVENIYIQTSKLHIKSIRLTNYNFWKRVREKFLL